MNNYRIKIRNKGVSIAKGNTPIEAFNSIFPNMQLTSTSINCKEFNVCIELINGKRHTTNYYIAQPKSLDVNQIYNEILQFITPYLGQTKSVYLFNKGQWNDHYPLSEEGLQFIKQHGGVIGEVDLDFGDANDDRGETNYVFKDLSYGIPDDFTIIEKGKITTLAEAEKFLYTKSTNYKYMKDTQSNVK